MVRTQIIEEYFSSLAEKYKTGQAREHAYRPVFETLIKNLDPRIKILNDPARSEHGNPDFVFLHGDITVGYTETKDIGVDLNKIETTKQIERYLGYSNLILTDYLEFRFFKNGQRYGEPIRIGQISQGQFLSLPGNFDNLANLLIDFLSGEPEPIKRGKRLAEIMGGKARRIRDNVKLFLDNKSESSREIEKVYETIKKLLVHDLKSDAFADMYAQTLVYGLFVARYYDETSDTFSRQEARDLIPKSNPFLRHFFDHIAGPDFDKRLEYIVKELCDIFALADVNALMHQYFSKKDLFGKEHESPDPVIHFYEDFLREYNPELRKKMGAFYTPLPVVRFIVRAVDEILKKDFNLPAGLADNSKIESPKGPVHKVQILDPAVGTGTFISETIRKIFTQFSGQEGRWATYVHHDLLPRLHGFELMMAPYTIAHLKIGMMMSETRFKYFNRRLEIYLTNSLEEGTKQDDLFSSFGLAESIAEEAKEASIIKNEKPIMVVIGNPPYSVSSSNKGKWITNLIDVYKINLKEKSYNALSDDYVKFIRFAEHFIEKNKTGIIAMITNNSFLGGITHRQMRKHLLETFDEIYILDLHGDSNKKEKSPDGSKDENVFDIQQGVSINIFIRKNEKKKKIGTIYHADFFGLREAKFEALNTADFKKMNWQKLAYIEPYYFFVPKDFGLQEEYGKGFKIDELFEIKAAGIKTHHDDVVIAYNSEDLRSQILSYIKNDHEFNQDKIKKICYRPFDQRLIYYDTKIIVRHRKEQIRHSFYSNIALLSGRQSKTNHVNHFFVTNSVSEMKTAESSTGSYHFPLYLYAEDGSRTLNFNPEIVAEIRKIDENIPPEDIFDYIYAVLHAPSYREKYKEFLKIDFPRVPYPNDKKKFRAAVALGRKLRELHLLESPKVNEYITTYPEDGSNMVEKISYKNGNVSINEKQYFGQVPEIAWIFYIGGYQPAQKWLKDRKGRTLTNEDIEHYQKMIVALIETDRIMKEIDLIKI